MRQTDLLKLQSVDQQEIGFRFQIIEGKPHRSFCGLQDVYAIYLVGFDLTTHRGHFMGSGHNRLVLYAHEGKTWVKVAGTWDPMPWHLDKAYRAAGEEAQHAFWGARDDEALSMLHQLAKQISA